MNVSSNLEQKKSKCCLSAIDIDIPEKSFVLTNEVRESTICDKSHLRLRSEI